MLDRLCQPQGSGPNKLEPTKKCVTNFEALVDMFCLEISNPDSAEILNLDPVPMGSLLTYCTLQLSIALEVENTKRLRHS